MISKVNLILGPHSIPGNTSQKLEYSKIETGRFATFIYSRPGWVVRSVKKKQIISKSFIVVLYNPKSRNVTVSFLIKKYTYSTLAPL